MKVLVTGATAQPGLALIDALLDDPEVEVVLATGMDDGSNLPADSRLVYHRADLTRARAVHDLLQGPVRALGIDAVVHGPLHRGVGGEGQRMHDQNVEVTRALLLGAADHPTLRRLVFRSSGAVYTVRAREPNLLDEDTALELDPGAPQWVRDRVEADLTVCARMGEPGPAIVVLRCAEILARGTGSQLWDYLQSRVCLRPLGFDPMINLLSLEDAVAAIRSALGSSVRGVYNIRGADTLPLSRIARRWRRRDVPVPGPLLAPLYRWRARVAGFEFRYDLNLRRFHFGGVLDGRRAERVLGYRPHHPIRWPDGHDVVRHGPCFTPVREGHREAGDGSLPWFDDRLV